MGIEDGYAIGALLAARGPGNYQTAFSSFERLRRDRVAKVQAWSRLAGLTYKLADPELVARRNATLWQLRTSLAWIHSYDVMREVEELTGGTVPLDGDAMAPGEPNLAVGV